MKKTALFTSLRQSLPALAVVGQVSKSIALPSDLTNLRRAQKEYLHTSGSRLHGKSGNARDSKCTLALDDIRHVQQINASSSFHMLQGFMFHTAVSFFVKELARFQSKVTRPTIKLKYVT